MKTSKVILIECGINHVAHWAIDPYNSVASDFRMIQIKHPILAIRSYGRSMPFVSAVKLSEQESEGLGKQMRL